MKLASMLSVLVLLVGLVISCGSNSSDNGPQPVTYSDPSEAANGASSAKASVDMTSAMSEAAAGLSSSSSNPAGYAPGKGGTTATDTSSIANIDPKLKTLVDGMLASMKAPAVRNAVSKARASKAKVTMSPGTPGTFTLTSSCTDSSGTFTITGTETSVAGTYVEYTVDIRFDSCKDAIDPMTGLYSVTTGTIHVYDKEMAGNAATTRNATIDLTAVKYNVSYMNVETDVAKGTFNATDSGTVTSRSGRNTASGSFSSHDLLNNETGTFYFTNMTGDWTWDVDVSGVETVANTANGNFGLNFVNASAETLTLNIGLSNLQNKLRFNANASIDQWMNGSVTITWTPDLSIFGCKSGRITFTTADATPLHYLNNSDTCPDSGTLQVNNATIVYYGPDDPNHIVVSVGALSAPLIDCTYLEGGICGN
jgi:hypothetical protein